MCTYLINKGLVIRRQVKTNGNLLRRFQTLCKCTNKFARNAVHKTIKTKSQRAVGLNTSESVLEIFSLVAIFVMLI